jgi:hypothetical protein
MGKDCSQKILGAVLALLFIHNPCLASETPADQNPVNKTNTAASSQMIMPISADATESVTRAEKNLPAIEEINSQLLANYGCINPNIKLAAKSHAKISHLSAKYESFPQDVSYNHEKNQVTLTWKTGAWGILKAKTRVETFNLAKKSVTFSLPSRHVVPVGQAKGEDSEQLRAIEPHSISPTDSMLSTTCDPGGYFSHSSANSQLKTYVFRQGFGRPRTMHDGRAAFFEIYGQFPDIYRYFALEAAGINRVAQDFINYGCPLWLDIALYDNGDHMLVLEWDSGVCFHYKLVWRR